MTTPEAGRLLRIADRLGQVAAGSRNAGRAIHAALAARGAEPRCGVTFIDLRTGDAPHWLRFGGEVQALYDLAVRLLASSGRSDPQLD